MLKMEISLKLIEEMTIEEIESMQGYCALAKEAREAYYTVSKACLFPMGQNEIVVYENGDNKETLTHDGMWKARYLHQSYDVEVTADAIFKVFKEEYNHIKSRSSKVNNIAESARYFRGFVSRCKDSIKEQKESET